MLQKTTSLSALPTYLQGAPQCAQRLVPEAAHKASNSNPENAGLCAGRRSTRLKVELGLDPEQLPVSFFLGHEGILPPLPSHGKITIDGVIRKLREEGALVEVLAPRESWQWRQSDQSSSGRPDLENKAHRKIEDITDAIRDVCSDDMEPRLTFKYIPNTTSDSVTGDDHLGEAYSKPKPDFCGVLRDKALVGASEEGPHWSIMAVPGGLSESTDEDDEVKNWGGIIFWLKLLMKVDPRRRFVFAFTIEGVNMRIWSASRAGVLVSLPFNFTERYDYTTEFFLRLMWAEEEQLGWDKTIHCMDNRPGLGECRPYHIECAGVTYKTVRLITASGAERLYGHGTRVWEVHALQNDGTEDMTPLVLKDSWPVARRRREGDAWLQIREEATRLDLLEGFEQHFIKVKAFEDVRCGEDGSPDYTRGFIRRANPAVADAAQQADDGMPVIPAEQNSEGQWCKRRNLLDPMQRVMQAPSFVHHRIVFEEVGHCVSDVDMLSHALEAVADAVKGLRILHQCGWVHRDISIGNILIVDGVGKLADLEYAQRETDPLEPEGYRRIGTAQFMASEVGCQDYAHLPLVKCISPEDVAEEMARREQLEAFKAKRESKLTSLNIPIVHSLPTFRHNPLHDLESLMWVEIWLLVRLDYTNSTRIVSDEDWPTYMQSHAQAAKVLWTDAETRDSIMRGGPWASVLFSDTIAPLLPPVVDLADHFDHIRPWLIQRYEAEGRASVLEQAPLKRLDVATEAFYEAWVEFLNVDVEHLRKTGNDLRVRREDDTPTDVDADAGAAKDVETASADGDKGAMSKSDAATGVLLKPADVDPPTCSGDKPAAVTATAGAHYDKTARVRPRSSESTNSVIPPSKRWKAVHSTNTSMSSSQGAIDADAFIASILDGFSRSESGPAMTPGCESVC